MAHKIKSAADMLAKWKQGMAGASAAYIAGTAAVTESPMAAAVAQVDKLRTNFNRSLDNNVWQSRTAAVSLTTWKDQCKIGAAKFQSGAAKGAMKYQRFAQQAQNVYQGMQAAAQQAGDDPYARVTAALRVLIENGRKAGGTAFQ